MEQHQKKAKSDKLEPTQTHGAIPWSEIIAVGHTVTGGPHDDK